MVKNIKFAAPSPAFGVMGLKKQDTSDIKPVNRAARRAIASNRKNADAKTDIAKWQRRK